jgi:hypothetical protein
MRHWPWGVLAVSVGCGTGEPATDAATADEPASPEAPVRSPLGAPEHVFTLPVPVPTDALPTGLYHPDLVASFPDVDFATLDRLQ